MEVHEILRELREMRQPAITQSDLAAALQTNQRKISRLETGEAEPSVDDLRRLCLFYQVSSDYILNLPADLPYPKRK